MSDVSVLLPPALLLASVLQIATRWGAGHRELLAASFVVIVTQLLPGALIWRTVRPRDGWLIEDVALGLAIGAALAVPSQVVAVSLSTSWLAAALPLLAGGVLLTVPSTRSRLLSARSRPLPWWWGLAVALACALPVVNAVKAFRTPVRWTGWAEPYVDFPYHLALSGELSHRFPPHYPQVAGDTLYYHWFSHAWVAQVSNLAGVPLDVVLLRFMPALLAVTIPLATAAVAIRVARSVWAGPWAAAIAFAVVDFDVWGFARLATPMAGPMSPTQGFGILVLLPTIGLLVLRWRGDGARHSYWLLVPLLVIVGGAKGSMLPVLVVGTVVATAQAVLTRSRHVRRVVIDTATATVVLLVLIKYLFGGGVGGTRVSLLDPLVAARGEEFLGTDAGVSGLALVSFLGLALLPTYLGAVAGLRVLLGRDTRRDPAGWLLAGCSLAGAGAILVLDHPGFAQYYFLRTSEAALSLLAAWGLTCMLASVRAPLRVIALGAAAGVAGVLLAGRWPGSLEQSETRHLTAWAAVAVFCCVAGAAATAATIMFREPAPGRRRAAVAVLGVAFSVAGIVPMIESTPGTLPSASVSTERPRGGVHSSEVRAARWIRDHSEPGDVVMTNQHCRTGGGPTCDHRRFYLAAYSERSVLVEGWAYTKTSNALGAECGCSPNRLEFWDQELLGLNDGFLVEPSTSDAAQLYDMGVRWIYVDRHAPHAKSLMPTARQRFRSRWIRVYELREPQSVKPNTPSGSLPPGA